MLLWIFLLIYVLIHPVTAVKVFTPDDFLFLNTTGSYKYILSKNASTFSSATNFCANIGCHLPLFDSNVEYELVFRYLNAHHPGGDIWVAINVVKVGNETREYYWKEEPVAPAAWGQYDPNGNCDQDQNMTCCGLLRPRTEYSKLVNVSELLIDGNHPCHRHKNVRFLCAVPARMTGFHDECSLGEAACSHECQDQMLGYECSCPAGLELDIDGLTCIDIDECQTNASCQQLCTNTFGSFSCDCTPGYELNSINTCTDINECFQNNTSCSHTCVNMPGSYRCECPNGFELDSDNHTCIDIDECQSGETGNSCQQPAVCVNTVGSYLCDCLSGYRNNGSELEVNCIDVDECVENEHNCSQICHNTDGAFSCQCQQGYEMDANSSQCVNIDECQLQLDSCEEEEICVDSPGSFTCVCLSGYQRDEAGTCVVVDECNSGTHQCHHLCENTRGSYTCMCEAGFHLAPDGNSCTDIDECNTSLSDNSSSPCQFDCINTPGSYYCTSGQGYNLNLSDSVCNVPSARCLCPCRGYMPNGMKEEIAQEDSSQDLTVEKRSLSLYRRRLLSIGDYRASANAIGFCGIFFLCIFGLILVMSDLSRFSTSCQTRYTGMRQQRFHSVSQRLSEENRIS